MPDEVEPVDDVTFREPPRVGARTDAEKAKYWRERWEAQAQENDYLCNRVLQLLQENNELRARLDTSGDFG